MAAIVANKASVAARVASVRTPQRAAMSRVVRTYAEPETAAGFVEKDSAGQTNMFATVTKPYEAGSAADTVQSGANVGIAVGAGALAVAAIVAGLVAQSVSTDAPVEPAGNYLALTAYKAKFAAELTVLDAPAVKAAPVVEAAQVVEEAPVVEEAAPEVVPEPAVEL